MPLSAYYIKSRQRSNMCCDQRFMLTLTDLSKFHEIPDLIQVQRRVLTVMFTDKILMKQKRKQADLNTG